MSYKSYAVRIFSYKWEESVSFYRDIVGLPLFYSDANFGWAQFDVGGVYLGLERCALDEPASKDLVGRFVGASLQVEDIEATYSSLCSKGVEFSAPPEKQPWGGTLAQFKDPDDNIITLLGGNGT